MEALLSPRGLGIAGRAVAAGQKKGGPRSPCVESGVIDTGISAGGHGSGGLVRRREKVSRSGRQYAESQCGADHTVLLVLTQSLRPLRDRRLGHAKGLGQLRLVAEQFRRFRFEHEELQPTKQKFRPLYFQKSSTLNLRLSIVNR